MASAVNLVFNMAGNYAKQLTGLNQGFELLDKSIGLVNTSFGLVIDVAGYLYKALKFVAEIPFAPLIASFNLLNSVIGSVSDAVYSLFGYLWDAIKTSASFAWDKIKELSGYLYDSFKNSIQFIWDNIKDLGAYATTVTEDFLSNFASSVFDTGAMFDKLKIRMEAVFGSGAIAQQALDWGTKFGASTPMQLEQVANAMTKLKVYGFDPMNGTLRILGDTSYALGTDLDGIIDALGKMALQGKVSARNLMQLTVRSIPAYDILKEKFHLTAKQVANIGNAGLDANEAIQAIIDSLGNKYSGAMERAANKTVGALSTIKDVWTVFQKQVADDGAWKAVTRNVVGFRDFLSTTLGGGFGKTIASSISNTVAKALNAFQAGGYLQKFVLGIGKTFSQAFTDIGRTIPDVTRIFDTVFNEALKGYQTFVKQVVDIFGIILPEVKKVIAYLPNITKAFKDSGNESIRLFQKYLPDAVDFSIKAVKNLVSIFEYAYKGVSKFIKDLYININRFAESTNALTIKQNIIDGFKSIATYVKNIFDQFARSGAQINFAAIWQKVVQYSTVVYNVTQGIFKVIGSIVNNVGKLVDKFGGVGNITDKIFANIGQFMRWLSDNAVSFINWIGKKLLTFADGMPTLFKDIKNGIGLIGDAIEQIFKVIGDNSAKIAKIATILFTAMQDYLKNIVVIIKGVGFAAIKTFEVMFKGLKQLVEAFNASKKSLSFKSFFKSFNSGTATMKVAFLSVFKFVAQQVDDLTNAIRLPFKSFVQMYNDTIGRLSNHIKLPEPTFSNGFSNALQNQINKAVKKLNNDNKAIDLAFNSDVSIDTPDFTNVIKAFDNISYNYQDTAQKVAKEIGSIDFSGLDFTKQKEALGLINKQDNSIEKLTNKYNDLAEAKKNVANQKIGVDKDTFDKILGFNKDNKGFKPIKIGLEIADGEMDKLKGEMIVKLNQDNSVASKLSENEMLVALAKLLKDALVQLAEGEPTPLVYQ